MSIPIRQVRTPDFTMNYITFGHGDRPFVILPGLSIRTVLDSADAIAAQYRIFEEQYTVWLFDRREDLPSSYTVREMARDTAEAIRALDLQDIDLFGASQGGMMALLLAARHPDLVHRLALGSSCARIPDAQFDTLSGWINLAEQGDAAALYEAFGKMLYPPHIFSAYRDTILAPAASATGRDLARFITLARGTEGFDATPLLSSVRCPVLVAGAYDDAVLGGHSSVELAGYLGVLPHFRLHMYRGFGHAVFDTAPDFTPKLYAFFAEG